MNALNPWEKTRIGVQSAVEATVNMDAIVVDCEVDGIKVLSYRIFSLTHQFSLECDGGLHLPVGVWLRLQYTGGDFGKGYLVSKYLRIIKTMPSPRYTKELVHNYEQGRNIRSRVTLILRAFPERSPNGGLIFVSEDIGYIMVGQNWELPQDYDINSKKAVVLEVEYVKDSWWLKRLLEVWGDTTDLRRIHSFCEKRQLNFRGKSFTDNLHQSSTTSLPAVSLQNSPMQVDDSVGHISQKHSRDGKASVDHSTAALNSSNEMGQTVIGCRTSRVLTRGSTSVHKPHAASPSFSTEFRLSHLSSHNGQALRPECLDRHGRNLNGDAEHENAEKNIKLLRGSHYVNVDENDLMREHVEKLSISKARRKTLSSPSKETDPSMYHADMPIDSIPADSRENLGCSMQKDYNAANRSGSDSPKWVPLELPTNPEFLIDITTEKPSGKSPLPAWCCIVKIRKDHIICYAPIPGIHKILIAAKLLKEFLDIDSLNNVLKLGNWINVICEPRCGREYDEIRQPHFSHIATKICAPPQQKPPVEPWNQRVVYDLLQVFLRCDLNVPGNVRRIQVENDKEKYYVLNCTHMIPVLVPARRLEEHIDSTLTADKEIGMWATRKKRVVDCDMFLIDSEEITVMEPPPICS